MVDDTRPAQSSNPQPQVPSESGRTRDNAARAAGIFLMLTALTTVVAVAARVSADADQDTLVESLVAISESKGLYGAGGAARIVSGITLIAAAWLLLQTWIIRLRLGTPAVPIPVCRVRPLHIGLGRLRRVAGRFRPRRDGRDQHV